MNKLEQEFLSTAEHKKRKKPGWEPGITIEGEYGEIVSGPMEEAPDWFELLDRWLPPGLTSDWFEILDDTIGLTASEITVKDENNVPTAKLQYHFKVRIRRLSPKEHTALVDLSNWKKSIVGTKAPKLSKEYADKSLIVCYNDWQIGKGEGGGWRATVERFEQGVAGVVARLKAEKPQELILLGIGDLQEGCGEHYDMQTYQVELNAEEQREVIANMIMWSLREYHKLVPKIRVYVVGGNHGENRKEGKAFTDFSDNADVGVFRAVKMATDQNLEAYGHVEYYLPRGELTQTFEAGGALVGIAHGHQFGSGVNPEKKADDWWKGHMDGMQAIGDASILVTAHYHHLRVKQQSRTWIQAPALDGGSEWFTSKSGLEAPPGVLHFAIQNGHWRDLQVS